MNLITLDYKDAFDNNKDKTVQFSRDLIKQEFKENSLFAIKVEGKSMQPIILDKALVIADLSQKRIENEGIYLIYKDNKMWIKKAKVDDSIKFVSINKDFSHLIYNKNEVHVVAKVLLTFTSL